MEIRGKADEEESDKREGVIGGCAPPILPQGKHKMMLTPPNSQPK